MDINNAYLIMYRASFGEKKIVVVAHDPVKALETFNSRIHNDTSYLPETRAVKCELVAEGSCDYPPVIEDKEAGHAC